MSLQEKKKDFSWYYKRYLTPIVKQIEKEKEESLIVVQAAKKRTTIICFFIFLLTYFLMQIGGGSFGWFFIISSSSLTYYFSYKLPAEKEKKRILHKIKKQLIRPILQFVSSDLTYDFESKIPKTAFVEANFVAERSIDVYEGEDLIHGKIGDVSLAFSELTVQKKEETEDGTKYIDLFNGLFFKIDFHKPFQGAVYTHPNVPLPKFLKKLISPNNNHEKLESVTLENPQFAKRFSVKATDQTLARFVLTPSLMERMLAFEQKKGNYMDFAFRNGVIFLGLRTQKDHFNFELTDTLNEGKLFNYLEELNLAVEIIEELQLNLHIWK